MPRIPGFDWSFSFFYRKKFQILKETIIWRMGTSVSILTVSIPSFTVKLAFIKTLFTPTFLLKHKNFSEVSMRLVKLDISEWYCDYTWCNRHAHLKGDFWAKLNEISRANKGDAIWSLKEINKQVFNVKQLVKMLCWRIRIEWLTFL